MTNPQLRGALLWMNEGLSVTAACQMVGVRPSRRSRRLLLVAWEGFCIGCEVMEEADEDIRRVFGEMFGGEEWNA